MGADFWWLFLPPIGLVALLAAWIVLGLSVKTLRRRYRERHQAHD